MGTTSTVEHFSVKVTLAMIAALLGGGATGLGTSSYRVQQVEIEARQAQDENENLEERLRKVETKQEVMHELRAISQSTLTEFKANQANITGLLQDLGLRLSRVEDSLERIER